MDGFSGLGAWFNTGKMITDEQAAMLANEKSGLANTYQNLINQRYGQETPYQLQKLLEENAKINLENQRNRGTLESDIETKKSSNSLTIDQNKTKQSIERNKMLIQAYSEGGKVGLFQKAKELGVSKDFFDNVINAPNTGEALTQNLQKLAARLAITPENTQAQNLQKLKEVSDLEKQRLANSGALAVAKQQGINQETTANIRAEKPATPPGTDKIYAALLQKMASGQELTADEYSALEHIARLRAAGKQQDVTIDPTTKNMTTTGQTGNILPGQKQTVPTGQTKSGNKYKIERTN